MRKLAFTNLPKSGVVPHTWEAPKEFASDEMQALFYEGLPYHGKPTRVFAWLAFPKNVDHPVPGIILVHGGGGTAYPEWVRLWTGLGFAVLAMDTCGSTPGSADATVLNNLKWQNHEYAGPGGWGTNDFKEISLEDQWPFHAVNAILKGFELLRSCPQVDADKIGITGISWGGFLTCLAASLEERFRFAIPVYGCGSFNTPNSSLLRLMTDEQRKAWFDAWNPDLYLPDAKMPFLWLTDAEDVAFPLDNWMNSTTLTQNPGSRLSLRIDYPHGHGTPWKSKTIPAFAKGCLDGTRFPQLSSPTISGNSIACKWIKGDREVQSVSLAYTRADGYWADRRWRSGTATIQGDSIVADLPPFATCAFLQLRTDDDCLWSSPIVNVK